MQVLAGKQLSNDLLFLVDPCLCRAVISRARKMSSTSLRLGPSCFLQLSPPAAACLLHSVSSQCIHVCRMLLNLLSRFSLLTSQVGTSVSQANGVACSNSLTCCWSESLPTSQIGTVFVAGKRRGILECRLDGPSLVGQPVAYTASSPSILD